jgi:WD40 repeat protein
LQQAGPQSVIRIRKIEIKQLPSEEPGWVPLFNGKDLTGWRSVVKSNTTWTWADGVLTAKGQGDLLVTDRTDYANFHLRLSMKGAIDSGASIRFRNADAIYGDRYLTAIRPAGTSDIHVGGGLTVFRDQQQTGLARNADVGPPDEWHTLEIIAVGNRIKTFANGKPVADVTDPEHTRMHGSIALSWLGQSEQVVHFKDVEIKELPPEPTVDPTITQVGEIRRIDGGHGSIWRAVLSSDGRHILAAGENGAVSLWTPTGAEVRTFKGHSKTVWGVALSEDGATAVSGGEDETVRVWGVETGEQRRVLDWKGNQVRSLAFTGDGRYVLAGSMQGEIRLWEAATGEQRWSRDGHTGNVHCVAFSSDGKLALSTDGIWNDDKSPGVIRIWDVATGEEINKLVGHDLYVGAAAFAPDGRTILSGSRDQTLRLWDVATGEELRRVDSGIWTEFISFSPDGRRFLTGGRDPVVRLWDLASGQVIARFSGHTDAAVSVHYHSDGQLAVSSSWDGAIRLWRLPE